MKFIVKIINSLQDRLSTIVQALEDEHEAAARVARLEAAEKLRSTLSQAFTGPNAQAVWGAAQTGRTVQAGTVDTDALSHAQGLQEALDDALELVGYLVGNMPAEMAHRFPFVRLRRLAGKAKAFKLIDDISVIRHWAEYAGLAEACEEVRIERAKKLIVKPATSEDWAAGAVAFTQEFGRPPGAYVATATPVPGAVQVPAVQGAGTLAPPVLTTAPADPTPMPAIAVSSQPLST